ncbi:MAG TPA: HD domain-containing phosphohydrolase [Candidatus Dormibacteraeota bacterium]|nr:HD domain-containing phosphohydrolase [Candidatus Dormibacteraeota bacterium]
MAQAGRRRSSIRQKIVLPFVVLLAFLGMVGTALITSRATTATVSAFEGSLLRASLLSNDHLAVLEAERLAQLRAAIDTQGVAPALAANDTASLTRLLRPIQANATPAQLTVRVLDATGKEVLTLTPAGTTQQLQPLGDLAPVRSVLNGDVDAQGDKYVFPRTESAATMLYWIGPVRSDPKTVVGAVLVGESMVEIADNIRDSRASELVFYDPTGHVLLSSLKGAPSLMPSVLVQLAQSPVRISLTIDDHPYEFLVGNWRLRSSSIGYLAAVLRADAVEASVAQIRMLMVLVFAAAALMTLLFGTLVARRITRPVEHLVRSTAAVSAGDLSHRAPIETTDEIGALAESFNAMAASLEQKTTELEESYFASIESLARAIDARDPSTFGHSRRVAAISLEIAQAMGIDAESRKTLRRAALLHDIGKIGIEDRVLHKSGPLTDDEWDSMKQHPLIGYKMLSGLNYLKPSLLGVLHHHERWDGKGFPAGLKGAAIPTHIRILSVADALDAMTSDRPYRKGLPFEDALAEIQNRAGTQFEPAAFEALMKCASAVRVLLMEKPSSGQPTVDLEWLERSA